MDCADTLKLIAGERGDDLDEVTSRRLEEHLDGCGPCQQALGAAEDELRPLGERLEPPEPSVEAWARVDAAVREAVQTGAPVLAFPGKAGRRSFPLYAAVAAAVLLALGAGLVIPLEPLFGPRSSGATATLLQPGAPSGPTLPPPEVHELDRAGQALRVEAGPRFSARAATIDDLLVVFVSPRPATQQSPHQNR